MHLGIASIVSMMKYRAWDIVSLVTEKTQLCLSNETWQIHVPTDYRGPNDWNLARFVRKTLVFLLCCHYSAGALKQVHCVTCFFLFTLCLQPPAVSSRLLPQYALWVISVVCDFFSTLWGYVCAGPRNCHLHYLNWVAVWLWVSFTVCQYYVSSAFTSSLLLPFSVFPSCTLMCPFVLLISNLSSSFLIIFFLLCLCTSLSCAPCFCSLGPLPLQMLAVL